MDGSFIKKGRGELTVKEGIHPNYAETKCHPFWTGNLKRETTGGRADKFKKKYGIQ